MVSPPEGGISVNGRGSEKELGKNGEVLKRSGMHWGFPVGSRIPLLSYNFFFCIFPEKSVRRPECKT